MPKLRFLRQIPASLAGAVLFAGCLASQEEPSLANIVPGIYEITLSASDAGMTVTSHSRIELRADGGFHQQGYLTGGDYDHDLAFESKGTWFVQGDSVYNRDIRERARRFSDGVDPWAEPESGPASSQPVRRITATSFQIRDEGGWVTLKRAAEKSFPEIWALNLAIGTESPLSQDSWIVTARKPYNPGNPTMIHRVDIRAVAAGTGDLASHMSRELARIRGVNAQNIYPQKILLDSSVSTWDSVTIGSARWSQSYNGFTGFVQMRLFLRKGNAVAVFVEGSTSAFSPGGELAKIDSSLTFF